MDKTLAELKEIDKYVDAEIEKINQEQEKKEKEIHLAKAEEFEQICDDILDLFQYSDTLTTDVPCESFERGKDGTPYVFYKFVNKGDGKIELRQGNNLHPRSIKFSKKWGYEEFKRDCEYFSNANDVFFDWKKTYEGLVKNTKDYMIHKIKDKINCCEEKQKSINKDYEKYCK